MLPEKATSVTPPAGAYDVLRGGLGKASVEASPEQPALFLERPTKIAKLTIDGDLRIRLTDEDGAPVDISVIHIDVYDPAGPRVRHYSGNATVRNGVAVFEIPFALNDPSGAWRIQARDVISGLTSQVQLQR